MTQEEWQTENEKLDALFMKIDDAIKAYAKVYEQEQEERLKHVKLPPNANEIIGKFLDELHI